MTSDVKKFDTLSIVPLDGRSPKEHVCNLSESQGGVWLPEQDIRWDHINVPLSEARAEQNQEMDDVGKTKGETREEHQEDTHDLVDEILGIHAALGFAVAAEVLTHVGLHDNLLKKEDIGEAGVAREVNREPTQHHVEHHQANVE